jgi:hypothetical protein
MVIIPLRHVFMRFFLHLSRRLSLKVLYKTSVDECDPISIVPHRTLLKTTDFSLVFTIMIFQLIYRKNKKLKIFLHFSHFTISFCLSKWMQDMDDTPCCDVEI